MRDGMDGLDPRTATPEVRLALLEQWRESHEKLADSRERRIDAHATRLSNLENWQASVTDSVANTSRLAVGVLLALIGVFGASLYLALSIHR